MKHDGKLDVKLIDELLEGRSTVESIAGENGLLKQQTKAILERALAAELTSHLGYEKHGADGGGSGNSRNGASSKRLKGDFGTVEIEVPLRRVSSRNWWPRVRGAGPASTTRFCRSMRGDDDARDPWPSGADVGGGVAGVDLDGHRRGAG